jgi:sporulation protein YlmC with PRC-barrel domain
LTSSTPAAPDPNTPAPSDRLWLRSELMGTQVITRDTGRRLGVVGEVMVDIDRREVVALGLRDNPLTRFLPGLPRWMPLERIRQVGDVILVDSADSLAEGFDPDRFSKVINCQVITESGAQLGRVLGFSFDVETGELTTLVIGALGVPLLGEGVLSTWEMPVGEIVSSGSDRIIVYEGAEEKLKQLGTGLLEKLGITKGRRSAYDHVMLNLHDKAKLDDAYQQATPRTYFEFPAQTTWLAFTDRVMHAALAGQFLLEQTFHLPVAAMQDERSAPLRILEAIYRRQLA